jgi:membrane associated rhomboid family serine protease
LWGEFSEQILLAYGAKANFLIDAPHHQWWRFVTPMFLHVNLIHILVNMYSLWIVGPYVEKLYGSAKFVVFWVLTGIAGVIGSYLTVRPNLPANTLVRFLFKDHDVVSAGASGALFGLVGVLFVFGIKFRRELPEGFKRAFGTGMLPIIMINLFIGYLGRGIIDNAAHVGGLVAGAALALVVQYRRPGERAGIAATWRVLQVAALLLVVVSFFKVAQHLRDPLPLTAAQIGQVENYKTAVFLNYVKAMNDAQEVRAEVLHDKQVSNVDQAVKNLQSVAPPDAKADELRGRLIALLMQAATARASSSPSPERGQKVPPKQEHDFVKDFASWDKEYDEWLKGAARTYAGPTQ